MTHSTTVRNMAANEGGRGNLAGFEIRCNCGFTMGTTLATQVDSIRAEHVRVMTRIDAERATADKKTRTAKRRRATMARNADPFGFKATGVL
jgi:hypothetical protein